MMIDKEQSTPDSVILFAVARAMRESVAANRQIWVESRVCRDGRRIVARHTHHVRGWTLVARVIGHEVF